MILNAIYNLFYFILISAVFVFSRNVNVLSVPGFNH